LKSTLQEAKDNYSQLIYDQIGSKCRFLSSRLILMGVLVSLAILMLAIPELAKKTGEGVMITTADPGFVRTAINKDI
jgi:hypothetical protein